MTLKDVNYIISTSHPVFTAFLVKMVDLWDFYSCLLHHSMLTVALTDKQTDGQTIDKQITTLMLSCMRTENSCII